MLRFRLSFSALSCFSFMAFISFLQALSSLTKSRFSAAWSSMNFSAVLTRSSRVVIWFVFEVVETVFLDYYGWYYSRLSMFH